MIPVLYNIVVYVIKQKRYQVFLVLIFYSTAMLTILARIAANAYLAHTFVVNSYYPSIYIGFGIGVISTSLKIAMGWFQCASMAELYYRIESMAKIF